MAVEIEGPTLESLAKVVLEWAGYDTIIKETGWDGGKHEAAWEDAKERMVEMARQVAKGKPWEEV